MKKVISVALIAMLGCRHGRLLSEPARRHNGRSCRDCGTRRPPLPRLKPPQLPLL